MTAATDFLWGTERSGTTQNVLVVPYRTPASSPDDLATTRRELFRLFWGFDEEELRPWRQPKSAPDSVAHWFETVSRGRLRLIDSGATYVATGDYQVPNTLAGLGLPPTPDLLAEGMRGKLIKDLADEIDFSIYRRGDDVDNNDLIVVMVERGNSKDSGAVRRTERSRLQLDGVDVVLNVASFSMGASLSTRAHELIHALLDRQPSTDLYGPSRWNTPGSLMGATGASLVSHPDAQHKLLLGWDDPELIDVARLPKGQTSTTSLLAAGATDAQRADHRTVAVLHDSQRGVGEFFVVEYRTPNGGADAGYRYDRSVGRGGLAIWHVESTGTRIATRPAYFRTSDAASVELRGDDILTGKGWLRYQGGGVVDDGVIALVDEAGSVELHRHEGWSTGDPSTTGRRRAVVQPDTQLSGRVIAADEGVLYEITDDGALLWHRVADPSSSAPTWLPTSGIEVGRGRGWNSYDRVIAAGNGVIYATKPNGALVWYRHTGWHNGDPTWADNTEREVGLGRGWNSYVHLLPAGNGVIYAIDNNGSLAWYRHTDWSNGNPTWADPAARFPFGEVPADDDAGVVHFGLDGTLVTDPKGAKVRSPASIHLVAAPDGAHGFRHGLWTDEHGDIWLRWYDGTSAGCRIRVGPGAGSADRLDVTVQTGVVATR
jgi:Tachylectin